MKKIFVTGLLATALAGCAGTANYAEVIKAPAPQELAGVWTTSGPQSWLVSPEAKASLIITRAGDTLDCRQWQRIIAKRGKLDRTGGEYYNVTFKNENYKIDLTGGEMKYDHMILHRVKTPTTECMAYLKSVNGDYIILQPTAPARPAATSHKKSGGAAMRNTKG
ncbi:lipoprotein YedD [Sodalis sp. dw_96]|uniref:lipoprotein YedD n=1 Tax=Sodalis sp. dw_96 TaxID=2719794 RepID=UPI001BD43ECA